MQHKVLQVSNQRAAAAAYSAGTWCAAAAAAAHTPPQPTADLVPLSGSLLHLDLCINFLLLLLPPQLSHLQRRTQNVDERAIAVTMLALSRVVTAVLRLLAT